MLRRHLTNTLAYASFGYPKTQPNDQPAEQLQHWSILLGLRDIQGLEQTRVERQSHHKSNISVRFRLYRCHTARACVHVHIECVLQ